MILEELCHVLDIHLNMISVERLDNESYSGNFQNDTLRFFKGNLIVARAQKQNTLYVMHAGLDRNEVNVPIDTTAKLWHKRLCHMSQKGMQMLSEIKLLLEDQKVHLEKCPDCLAGKQNTTAFCPRPPTRRKNTLELVHTNVC